MTRMLSSLRPTSRLAALCLSNLSLVLCACNDTETIEYLDTSGSGSTASKTGTASSYVPSLGGGQGTSSSQNTGRDGDDLWPTTTSPERSSSTPIVPETTSVFPTTSSSAPTSTTPSGGSSSGTTSGTTSGTGGSSTSGTSTGGSSTGTGTGGSSDSSGDNTDTQGPVGSDHAPRFGMDLTLEFEGVAPNAVTPKARVYMAEVKIMNKPVEPGMIPGGPELAVDRVLYDYPLFKKGANQAQPRVVLPTPGTKDIDATLGRSPFYMLALYNDDNEDKRWTTGEQFIAASPSLFFYAPSNENNAERWMRWTRFDNYAVVRNTPVAEDRLFGESVVEQEPGSTVFRGFSMMDPSASFSGQRSELKLSHGTSFVTVLTRAELQDLNTSFIAGPRPLDHDIRTASAGPWEIKLPDLGSMDASSLEPFIQGGFALEVPPGLALSKFVALPLVGYARPVGAALPGPNQFLTANSQLTHMVCGGRGSTDHAALIWIKPPTGSSEPGPDSSTGASTPAPWITRPIGALYAASLGLGPGWGLGVTSRFSLKLPRLFFTGSMTGLKINEECALVPPTTTPAWTR